MGRTSDVKILRVNVTKTKLMISSNKTRELGKKESVLVWLSEKRLTVTPLSASFASVKGITDVLTLESG